MNLIEILLHLQGRTAAARKEFFVNTGVPNALWDPIQVCFDEKDQLRSMDDPFPNGLMVGLTQPEEGVLIQKSGSGEYKISVWVQGSKIKETLDAIFDADLAPKG